MKLYSSETILHFYCLMFVNSLDYSSYICSTLIINT